mgnify:CR=1 FL=1
MFDVLPASLTTAAPRYPSFQSKATQRSPNHHAALPSHRARYLRSATLPLRSTPSLVPLYGDSLRSATQPVLRSHRATVATQHQLGSKLFVAPPTSGHPHSSLRFAQAFGHLRAVALRQILVNSPKPHGQPPHKGDLSVQDPSLCAQGVLYPTLRRIPSRRFACWT